MIFWHILDISKTNHQKDNNFLNKNRHHFNKYQYIPSFNKFFTLVAVTPDQDLKGCRMEKSKRVNVTGTVYFFLRKILVLTSGSADI